MKRILILISLFSMLIVPVHSASAHNMAALDGETAVIYQVSRPGYFGEYGVATKNADPEQGRYRADIDFVVGAHKVRAMLLGTFQKDRSDSSLLIVGYKKDSWVKITGKFDAPLRVAGGSVQEPVPLSDLVMLALSSPLKSGALTYGRAKIEFQKQSKPFPTYKRLPEYFGNLSRGA